MPLLVRGNLVGFPQQPLWKYNTISILWFLRLNAFRASISLNNYLLSTYSMINSVIGPTLHTKHSSLFLQNLTVEQKIKLGTPVIKVRAKGRNCHRPKVQED